MLVFILVSIFGNDIIFESIEIGNYTCGVVTREPDKNNLKAV